ncbi:MAG: hypothetical protein GY696_09705 [Gammaproteobacteria bacterium]|nr:hypothetical protein [Gammaproteobacteria bacterium]
MELKDVLQWPIIRLTEPKGFIMAYRNEKELFTARYIGIRDLQKLKSCYIVDSKGQQYSLSNPKLFGPQHGIIRRLMLDIINPLVRIEYCTIKSMGEADLSGMKKKLTQNINRYSEFWMEMDINTLDTLIERVNSAQTIKDWRFGHFIFDEPDEAPTSLIAFEKWASDYSFYERLLDGGSTEKYLFRKYKDLIEQEYVASL